MMVLTIVISAAIYCAQLWRHGTTVTPDGRFYLAMGNGGIVPRPYALRVLPSLIRTLAGWRVVHAVSYLALIAATYAAVHHVSAAHAMPAALTIAALPSVRQSASWPVLTDMPTWALIACGVVAAQHDSLLAMGIIGLGVLITERATILATVAALPWLATDAAVGLLALSIAAAVAVMANTPAADSDIEWLRHPFKTAMAKHRQSSVISWWLPWGGAVLALPCISKAPLSIFMVAVAYAQCLVAQDRARLYTAAAVTVVMAFTGLDPMVAWIAAVITYFTPITEV